MKKKSWLRGNSLLLSLLPVLGAIVAVAIVGAVMVYATEAHHDNINSFWDAAWYTVVTMTTVGYGDIVPKSALGRIAGVFIMLAGISVISLLTATISSIFVEQRIMENRGLRQIKLKGHTIVCGWNQRIKNLLETLNNIPQDRRAGVVLVNEMPPERMDEILSDYSNLNIKYVYGDYTKEPTLSRANVKEASAAVILPDASQSGIPRDDKTLPAALTVKSLKRDIKVYAHIIDRENITHLKRAGGDDVIVSDDHVGFLLASEITSPGIAQAVATMLNAENGARLRREKVPSEFVGKKFADIQGYFKSRHNCIAIGLVTEEEAVKLSDILSSDYSAIDTFIERKFKAAGIDTMEKGGVHLNLNPPLDYVVREKEDAIVVG
jgi:voltage-gated potassium channel